MIKPERTMYDPSSPTSLTQINVNFSPANPPALPVSTANWREVSRWILYIIVAISAAAARMEMAGSAPTQVGAIQLATFANPGGLASSGGNLYAESIDIEVTQGDSSTVRL